MSPEDRHALVLGASGLIGRHLVLALGQAGVRVSTASRSHESYQRLNSVAGRARVRPGPDRPPGRLRQGVTDRRRVRRHHRDLQLRRRLPVRHVGG
ncbi:NAD-dependent epimerase/dehydratase family protein [Streptomyces sp. NPDC102437]|uniref:NAD-dependent epimerase/dehydratase family protein n=1 Tax=Streptomyces sp. NPDC102437 TaxID=3366175 RepID=UPI0038267F07